jgi:cell division protein FtsB
LRSENSKLKDKTITLEDEIALFKKQLEILSSSPEAKVDDSKNSKYEATIRILGKKIEELMNNAEDKNREIQVLDASNIELEKKISDL